jgi:hypothetical protein
LQQRDNQRETLAQPSLKGLLGRMRSWFQGNF